jgi:hypothetical protein
MEEQDASKTNFKIEIKTSNERSRRIAAANASHLSQRKVQRIVFGA